MNLFGEIFVLVLNRVSNEIYINKYNTNDICGECTIVYINIKFYLILRLYKKIYINTVFFFL